MSLATLKKRTKTTYRRLSGISSAGGFNVNRTSPGNSGAHFKATTDGGGFSINGPHRNIGRVGQSMGMSKTRQTQKAVFIPGTGPGTGVYSAHGGYNNSVAAHICCDLPLYSHPSVMNTRGLLTLKKEKFTHLNWVQPGDGHADHTQSNYIENKVKSSRQIYKLPKCNQGKSCDTNTLQSCKHRRINHRIIPSNHISKDLHTMDGAEYMNYRKGRHATLPTKQYRQSWPPPISGKSGAPTAVGCKKRETYEDFLSGAEADQEMATSLFDCANPCI